MLIAPIDVCSGFHIPNDAQENGRFFYIIFWSQFIVQRLNDASVTALTTGNLRTAVNLFSLRAMINVYDVSAN